MNKENVLIQLAQVTVTVSQTKDIAQLPEIEKDILLFKLRNIYESIKYATAERDINDPDEVQIPSLSASQAVSENEVLNYETVIPQNTCDDRPEPALSDNETTKCEANEISADLEIKTPANAQQPEQTSVSEPANVAEEENIVAPASEPSEPEPVIAAQEVHKPKVDRKTLLSLYGDDDEPVSSNHSASHYDDLPEITPVLDNDKELFRKPLHNEDVQTSADNADRGVGSQRAERFTDVQTASDSIPSGRTINDDAAASNVVIGDLLASPEPTIADSLDVSKTSTPLADKLKAENVSSLKSSIGVNDKFLMLRDLFEGDMDKYNTAIQRLDEFSNLDDAMLYIYENYSWNPNSEAVKLLVELLSHKLA